MLPTAASQASQCQDKDGPSGDPLGKFKKVGRNGLRVEQVWKCTKRTNLYFDKQNNYPWLRRKFLSRKGPECKKEKKKTDANVNRKFGIMKWSQSPGKRWEVNILSWAKLFSPQALGTCF